MTDSTQSQTLPSPRASHAHGDNISGVAALDSQTSESLRVFPLTTHLTESMGGATEEGLCGDNEAHKVRCPSNPATPRHKVSARRCVIGSVKAPPVHPSNTLANTPITQLETAHGAPIAMSPAPPSPITVPPTIENTGCPAKLPSMLVRPLQTQFLQYELMSWYHELQYQHARNEKKTKAGELFNEYVKRTADVQHYNLFLEGHSLDSREETYHILIGRYYQIKSDLRRNKQANLEELLASFDMSKQVRQVLAGDPPPRVSYEEALMEDREERDEAREQLSQAQDGPFNPHVPLPGRHTPLSSANSSPHPANSPCTTMGPGCGEDVSGSPPPVVEPEELSGLSRHVVCKLFLMMRGLVSRAEGQLACFENKLKNDESNFRDNISNEFDRHEMEMRNLLADHQLMAVRDHLLKEIERHKNRMSCVISGRNIELLVHSDRRRQLRQTDDRLSTQMLEMLEASATESKGATSSDTKIDQH
ncbi:hypothetical protein PGT21_032361 [Puccinia graminis f. sp. tritici]|uniref:Uncharacterized protein n=1 Tax=Puccinia graminis f. sp. tritici TaxID=56615 RepID=A0A5B0QCE7_PUCGR|nr:hypothetical protein PGT21_032361 [Puccinia graminis f. sp. tritici]